MWKKLKEEKTFAIELNKLINRLMNYAGKGCKTMPLIKKVFDYRCNDFTKFEKEIENDSFVETNLQT